MIFETGAYFATINQDTFYPKVEVSTALGRTDSPEYESHLNERSLPFAFSQIIFDYAKPEEHYHIPLLLSPYSYTTYRGS